jgi:hypothetical protein
MKHFGVKDQESKITNFHTTYPVSGNPTSQDGIAKNPKNAVEGTKFPQISYFEYINMG